MAHRILAGLALSLALVAAEASPTGGELLKTCEAAVAADYKTQDASMCDWYVAPCGVCGKDGPPKPDWCLPPALKDTALARFVADELRKTPALLDQPAPAAVKAILGARFPCPH